MLYQLSYLAAAGRRSVYPRLAARHVSLPAVNVKEADREVAVIGGTLDLGAGRRGVDMGPSAIRYAGLEQLLTEKLGVVVTDEGNVISPVVETTEVGDERARYLSQILDLCDRVAHLVAEASRRGAMPLVLGGDHSVALGSLVGMAKARGPGGVVWVDAHGDVNTPDDVSDAATSTGWCSPLRSASQATRFGGTAGRSRRWTRESWRWSVSARSTRASASCWGGSTRRSSR